MGFVLFTRVQPIFAALSHLRAHGFHVQSAALKHIIDALLHDKPPTATSTATASTGANQSWRALRLYDMLTTPADGVFPPAPASPSSASSSSSSSSAPSLLSRLPARPSSGLSIPSLHSLLSAAVYDARHWDERFAS